MSYDTAPLAPNDDREDHTPTPPFTTYTYVSNVPPEINQSEEFKQMNNEDRVPGVVPINVRTCTSIMDTTHGVYPGICTSK